MLGGVDGGWAGVHDLGLTWGCVCVSARSPDQAVDQHHG